MEDLAQQHAEHVRTEYKILSKKELIADTHVKQQVYVKEKQAHQQQQNALQTSIANKDIIVTSDNNAYKKQNPQQTQTLHDQQQNPRH